MKWYPTNLGTPIPIFRGREHRAMSIGQEAATEQWAVSWFVTKKRKSSITTLTWLSAERWVTQIPNVVWMIKLIHELREWWIEHKYSLAASVICLQRTASTSGNLIWVWNLTPIKLCKCQKFCNSWNFEFYFEIWRVVSYNISAYGTLKLDGLFQNFTLSLDISRFRVQNNRQLPRPFFSLLNLAILYYKYNSYCH